MSLNKSRLKRILGLCAEGDFRQAAKLYKKQSGEKSTTDALLQLSRLCARNALARPALRCCELAVEREPAHALAHSWLANTLLLAGDEARATNYALEALRLDPENASLHYNFAVILRARGSLDTAVAHLKKSLALESDSAKAHYLLGMCYQSLGNESGCELHFNEALNLKPDYVECRVALSLLHVMGSDLERAAEQIDQALALAPHDSEALSASAYILLRSERRDEAWQQIQSVLNHGHCQAITLWVWSHLLRSLDNSDELLDCASQLLARGPLSSEDKPTFYSALGRTHEHRGEYPDAFANYKLANDCTRTNFDGTRYIDWVNAIADTWRPEKFGSFPRCEPPAEQLIFIVGMPRSGTTLTEQILASHSQVVTVGESLNLVKAVEAIDAASHPRRGYPDDIPGLSRERLQEIRGQVLTRYTEKADGASVIIDKLPTNYLYMGLICQLFPNARFIHCQRDPRDIALSIFFQDFRNRQPYSNKLESIALVIREYCRLMQHWQASLHNPVLHSRYEQLVDDTEARARHLIDFCSLDWEPQCLEYHRRARNITTASFDQANRPVYRSSLATWKRYQQELSPFMAALEPSIKAMGYEP